MEFRNGRLKLSLFKLSKELAILNPNKNNFSHFVIFASIDSFLMLNKLVKFMMKIKVEFASNQCNLLVQSEFPDRMLETMLLNNKTNGI